MMKKLFLLTLVSALPLTLLAQDDDMYFVPSKDNQAKEAKNYGMPKNTYYSGSSRSVDDYNRRAWSRIELQDSVGNDIIDFSAVHGVYPDSLDSLKVTEDYQLTRRMSRFDDYTPNQAYWDGYRDGRRMSPWYYGYSSWYWNDPWYWRSSWYWEDPWYYGGYYGNYGYYSPWYNGSYYRPWYYGGYYRPYYYVSGGGRVSSGRPVNHRPRLNGSNYGGNRGRSERTINDRPVRTSTPSSFGGYRSNSSSSMGSGGGSFSSGGSFGGGRSASGGRSFGGRR